MSIEEKQPSKATRDVLLDQESPFGIDELFFSVTQADSKITFVNNTFVRVAKFSKAELLGKMHNIIRHPDMPRTVFKIMWNYLLAGKPMSAYVKNKAKDGSYYWVVAMVFPCEGGFLSIRLKPSTDLFETVNGLYKSILEHEKAQENAHNKRKALELTEVFIMNHLKELGFYSFDEFMWTAMAKEMVARERKIKDIKKLDDAQAVYRIMNIMGDLLDTTEVLSDIQMQLVQHSSYLIKLTKNLKLLALNAQLSSNNLGKQYSQISVVAENLTTESVSGEAKLGRIQTEIRSLRELLGQINFSIISAKLQLEMAHDFEHEFTLDQYENHSQLLSNEFCMKLLESSYMMHISEVVEKLNVLPKTFETVYEQVEEIKVFMNKLRLIYTLGVIQVSQLDIGIHSFANTFQELVQQIDFANEKIKALNQIFYTNREISKNLFQHQLKIRALLHEA